MWGRLESNFFNNPKVEGLDDHSIVLYLRAWCRAVDQLTDGKVSGAFVRGKRQTGFADRLVARGLWHRAQGLEKTCPRCWEAVGREPGDGWVIHDFLRYNPSKASVEARRSNDRLRKATRSDGNPGDDPQGFQSDSSRIPRAHNVRTDEREETALVNTAGLQRLRNMGRGALRSVPAVSPSEVRAEADRFYRRPLAREELA